MLRNRSNSYMTAGRHSGASTYGAANSVSDLNNRLDELSARLGQLNTVPPPPPRRDTHAADELSEIAATVDRLVDRIGNGASPARKSRKVPDNANRRTETERDRLGSILSTLDGIDRRVQGISTDGDTGPAERSDRNAPQGHNDVLRHAIDEITNRQATLDQPPAVPSNTMADLAEFRPAAIADVERHFKSLAEKIDTLRQGDAEAAINRLHREIASLRGEVERRDSLGLSESDAAMIRELGRKVDDLSSSQPDLRTVEALRDEIVDLRQSVISNNVEGTLHSLESGYQHIVERLDELRRTIGDPRLLVRLADRIDTIDGALKTIPQVEQITMLDDRIDGLSRQVDGLSLDLNDPGVAHIERQIAELKEALGGVDTSQAIFTLDNQLRALHEKLDTVERLGAETHAYSQRIGSLESASLPPEALSHLSGQIDELRTAMSGDRETERFQHLDDSITEIGRKLDTLESLRAENEGMAQLERRIDEVVVRIENIVPTGPSGDAFAALENRINEIAGKLDTLGAAAQTTDKQALNALEATVQRIDEALRRTSESDALTRLDDRISNLSGQIDDLNSKPLDVSEMANLRDEIAGMRNAFSKPIPVDLSRLEHQIHALNDTVSAPQGGIDPDVLVQLEDQVSRIAQHIDSDNGQTETLSAIEGALSHIHKRLDDSRDEASAAARQAARDALSEFAGSQSPGNDGQLQAVQDELRSLQAAAHDSSERTHDTLIALHETLQAMAGRLLHLEHETATAPRAPVTDAPANPAGDAPRAMAPADRRPVPAGVADLPQEAVGPEPVGDRVAPQPATPYPSLDEDTRPLEPGTGRPDPAQIASLDARPHGAEGEPSDVAARDRKADFIAAARRAAQAAAAGQQDAGDPEPKQRRSWFQRRRKPQEPAISETEPAPQTADDLYATPLAGSETPPSAGGIGGVLKKHKRLLMIAAAGLIVIVGGLQLAKLVLPSATPDVAYQETQSGTADPVEKPLDGQSEPSASAPPPHETAPAAEPVMPAPSADFGDGQIPPQPAAAGPDTKSSARTGFSDRPAATPAAFGSQSPSMPAAGSTVKSDAAVPSAGTGMSAPMPPEAVGTIALRQAAADGNAAAQFEIAARYTEGGGVKPNLKIAAEWYQRAARQGLAQAQYRLGSLYEKGTGVGKDLDIARDWYRQAAEQGNTKAMHNLAVLYAEGVSGAPDFATAGKWFDKAAKSGVRDSQYNLGILYARGLGVPQDLKNSYKWFALAAKLGDSDAGKKRDEIANALDRKGLAAARLAVETWQRAPIDEKSNGDVPLDESWGQPPSRSASAAPTITTQQASTAAARPTASQRDLIQQAQVILSRLGYDPGPADGLIGPRTRDAVLDFQRKAGMPATGTIDASLIAALSKQAI